MATITRQTPFGPVEITDAHSHLFSHRFFQMLAAEHHELSRVPDPMRRIGELTGFSLPPEDPRELAEIWREELDRHSVASALLIASLPGDEPSVAEVVAAEPTRFAGAFLVDPTRADTEERVRRAFDTLGLRVACLFPAMHRYAVSECEGARAIAALAGDRPGTAVFVHCGALAVGVRKKLGLPSRFDMRYSNPLALHPLAAEFSSASFLVPHFGAGMFREALMLADLCPNVHLDTSSSNAWMRYEAYPLTLPEVFRRAVSVVGYGRLMFGTDSSFFPRGWQAPVFDAQVAALADIGASPEQARQLFGGNLRALLHSPFAARETAS